MNQTMNTTEEPTEQKTVPTQGAWIIEADSGYPINIISAKTQATICRIGGHPSAVEDDGECRANAELIGNIPNIINSLRHGIRAFEQLHVLGHHSIMVCQREQYEEAKRMLALWEEGVF